MNKKYQFARFLQNGPMFSPDTGAGDGGTGAGDGAGDGTGEDGTGAGTGKDDDGVVGKDDRTVTYSRFKKVNDDKKLYQTENTTLKTQLTDAQNLLKGKDSADATLKSDNDNLKSQLLAERLRNSFITEASKQGLSFHDLDDVIRLADFSEVNITDKGIDKDDMVDVVKEFAKRKPHMLKVAGADGNPNFPKGTPPKGGDGGKKTPEQLAVERAKTRSARNTGGANDPWAKK